MSAILQILVTKADDFVSSTTGILFPVSQLHKTIHYSFVAFSGLLAAITFLVQWRNPAPYGKLKTPAEERKWGPKIPIIPAHVSSDGPSGTIMFLIIYLRGSQHGHWTNWMFASLFMAHYFQRGFIHPFIMKYGQNDVPVGIWFGGLAPNILFHGLVADWLANAVFPRNHLQSPVVLLGLVLFFGGFIVNRVADWKQREWKRKQDEARLKVGPVNEGYTFPKGWLFDFIANPNYFGELVEWTGFLLITQAPASLTWDLFSAATFFARSAHNLAFYQKKFADSYPRHRKALIPFIY
ncbi:putative 3-oxo-5-alpha-steroid 4-dehydrogenase 1 [Hypsibius exemplaris]|uniref:3-oxo-5-alpha-steroid 4-dehydrogenase 1 n=1 Tax=Hypsibius exemplaris TaxID=2072580 RepID=A0A9X6RPI6_HYPEX|nr:putative 3-oxo-5-alpha-steroid 4-dehydrogenase 1 [Hypsibius exemplaris]